MRTSGLALAALAVAATFAPGPAQAATSPATRTWRCRHVLAADGSGWLENVVVTTAAGKITAVRSDDSTTAADLDFGEAWMVPGLIDLHTHLLLRPYDERSWDDQVLHDSVALRSMRALHYAEATLLAGWVAVRDLGTEGADFADVALQQAFAEGVGRGPLLYAATRAIVQCGRYGPAPDDPKVRKGAQPVSGIDEIRTAVAEQIDGGAQWIKVYADYRYGEGGGVSPTFSLAELEALCAAAAARGRPVAAHATTEEGIRRAVLAGVRTIEHGAGASETTLALMRDRGVVLVPCLAANEAIVRYAGHQGPVVGRLNAAKIAFQRALAAGVTIACGSDAGVFAHGSNARELELMVEYGMTPAAALASATRTAAAVLGNPELGAIRPGARCGLVVVDGDPLADIGHLRRPRAVVRARLESTNSR